MKNSLKFLNSFRRYEDFLLQYCVKSVQIRSYFWAVFSCIRNEYRKIQTRNSSVFGHFSRSVLTIFISFSDFLTFPCCKETNDVGI